MKRCSFIIYNPSFIISFSHSFGLFRINMLPWIRIFRLPNLLMIALTQFLVRYCIIMPAYITEYKNTKIFPGHLSHFEFLLLVFATVIIAAAGYVINDVFDVYTDEINKPGKNQISKRISEKTARTISTLFFISGSIIGLMIALRSLKQARERLWMSC